MGFDFLGLWVLVVERDMSETSVSSMMDLKGLQEQ